MSSAAKRAKRELLLHWKKKKHSVRETARGNLLAPSPFPILPLDRLSRQRAAA